MASSVKSDREYKEMGVQLGVWSRQIEFQYGNELKIRKERQG
jgi:hypothetical protein